MAVVTFTTDFGMTDTYVGAMKGVVLGVSSTAVLVDITHAIPAQDVRAGALALADAAPYFPAGSVHVAVVDPGVGGARQGIVVASGGHFFVGPDNGVLSLAASRPRQVFLIESPSFRRETVCPTFHGRDVFAVAAGQLAAGRSVEEAGPLLDAMTELPGPAILGLTDDCRGEVLHVDQFGNLVTSFSSTAVEGRWEMQCDGRRFELAAGRTYSAVGRGALLLYAGSSGRLEIAVRDGSAALLTHARPGTQIHLKRLS
jgi:S-adenosyl-L-methionine hydrolase (adenosine-forming)